MSLLEMKLEPLRTSSTNVRPPVFTLIRAPIASRVDFDRPGWRLRRCGLCAPMIFPSETPRQMKRYPMILCAT